MVCNSALPKGHPQQHVENLDRANFIRSACPGMDLNKCVMQLARTAKMTPGRPPPGSNPSCGGTNVYTAAFVVSWAEQFVESAGPHRARWAPRGDRVTPRPEPPASPQIDLAPACSPSFKFPAHKSIQLSVLTSSWASIVVCGAGNRMLASFASAFQCADGCPSCIGPHRRRSTRPGRAGSH